MANRQAGSRGNNKSSDIHKLSLCSRCDTWLGQIQAGRHVADNKPSPFWRGQDHRRVSGQELSGEDVSSTFERRELIRSSRRCDSCRLILNHAWLWQSDLLDGKDDSSIRKGDELKGVKREFIHLPMTRHGEWYHVPQQKVVMRASNFSRIPSGHDPRQFDNSIPWEARIETASRWIDECCELHPSCSLQRLGGKPPCRLLVIRPDFDSEPSESVPISRVWLVRTETLREAATLRYAALSHRWGHPLRDPIPPTTLTTNVERFETLGIAFSELPKTFRDAAIVTASLGLMFLWVDSLCIVQDDNTDKKAEEVANMGSIYSNAFVTIAADSAQTCAGGLDLDITAWQTYNYRHSNRRIHCFLPGKEFSFRHSPLISRGWALQEMVLSPRVIHFTERMMFWHCAHSQMLSEDGTVDRKLEGTNYYSPNPVFSQPFPALSSEAKASFSTWWTWAEGYSLRALTEPVDRLDALAGITRYFAQTTESTPLAGLWEQNLISDLLWRYAPTDSRGIHGKGSGPSTILAPTQLGIPSWSWLQRFCPIKTFPWPEFQEEEYGTSMVSHCVAFRQCTVNWSGQELSSRITRAELHGLGQFCHVSFGRDSDSSLISEKPGIYITAGGVGRSMPRAIGRAFLDAGWTQESLPTKKVSCLRIMTWNGRDYILLVEPKSSIVGRLRSWEKHYERVGVGWLENCGFCEDSLFSKKRAQKFFLA